MKILYLRERPQNDIRGCVVVLDKEHIGYFLYHSKIKNRKGKIFARHIALGRAKECQIKICFGDTLAKFRKGRYQEKVHKVMSDFIFKIMALNPDIKLEEAKELIWRERALSS